MRNIIFGTDFCGDCDDVFAARILARAHKSGKINLIGASVNAYNETSAAALDGCFNLEGISDVPIGISSPDTDFDTVSKYHARLAVHARKYKTNIDAEDGARIYRRLVSESDGPVEIVEVGFLTNLAAFIESGADDISPKTGLELIAEKVTKIWSMAGKWDEQGGREYNICFFPRARCAAASVFEKCPVPITLLGFEIGCDVISGTKLDDDDYLKAVLADYGYPDGRSSWDPMTALLAVIGDEARAGYRSVRGFATVSEDTGANYFLKHDGGNHVYLERLYSAEYYRDLVDEAVASMKE